ncbi:hypothetical protein [Nostoc sp. PA-18-2419]|uniref:hypothetical protein n=1 Tax=Nostoc sp. PA-18-2419 TaxID=2575443 RepID=UPI0011080C3D|nr:hypothetical protein [Nostoc sp. PA-18-2419]
MNAYKIHKDNQDDIQLFFFVQIPQSTPIKLEIKVEPGYYTFYLNKAVLKQIEQAPKIGSSLYIPPKLLAYLWYYNCFSNNIFFTKNTERSKKLINSPKSFKIFNNSFIVTFLQLLWIKSLKNKSTLQDGLIFNLSYTENTSVLDFSQEEDTVLQSNVCFSGEIIHKIRNDFIQNPECLNIVYIHYWLIEQILSYLKTKLNLLAWELALLFPVGFLAWKLPLLQSLPSALSIFASLGIYFIFAIIRYWLVNQFPRWTYINSQYRNWLAWGITCLTPIIFIHPTDFLFLLFFSLIGPLFQWIFSFILRQVGKGFLRWLLA